MLKSTMKITAFVLAFVLLISAFAINPFAVNYSTPPEITEPTADYLQGKKNAAVLEFVVRKLISGLMSIFPVPEWEKFEDYVENTEYKGKETFTDTVTAEYWKAGYSARSFMPDDIASGKYGTAGYFGNFPRTPITGVLDDQRIRVVALDAGDGVALFISMDALGMTNINVKKFRESLASVVAGANVISINICSTHSHTVADLEGIGVDMIGVLKKGVASLFTRKPAVVESVDPDLLASLFSNAKLAVGEALGNMKEGRLSYAAIDAADIINDKQTPIAFDPNINHIKFVPNDGSNEIWLVNMGVHPTTMPSDTQELCADYPGQIEAIARERYDADVAFYQGAQSAISRKLPPVEKETPYEQVKRYASTVLDKIEAADKSSYVELEPILNIKHKEVIFDINNPVLWAGCTLGVTNNKCLSTGDRIEDMKNVSEIGYAEFGKTLAIVLLPGEISPELIWGGAKIKELAWNEEEWKYDPVSSKVGGRHLIAFGLTNDHIGYVVADNDCAPPLADTFKKQLGDDNKHYEEMLMLSKTTGSELVTHLYDLIASTR